MNLAHWVKQFGALGCSSVIIDAYFRYRPVRLEGGKFAWVEAEPHEENATEKPHRIIIRPSAAEPFLVQWVPDDLFLETARRSRLHLRGADPAIPEAAEVLARLKRQLQERHLTLAG